MAGDSRHGSGAADGGDAGTGRTRRSFLRAAAATLAALGAARFDPLRARDGAPGAGGGRGGRKARPDKDKKEGATGKGQRILVLGGTRFLGPAVVDAALRRGHTVTLFNRGKTDPGRFPKLETLIGDRDGKLDALKGRTWDAVVDTSGYVPRVVSDSATLLKDAKQYVFISTESVYSDTSKPGMDETAPVGTIPDPTIEKVTNESYGPLKALCEQAAEKAMPGKVTNIRPGLIVGPDDPSDRFTYWPVRVAKGGEVLAPGTPSDPIQYIDVRDLGDWVVRTIEERTFGVFNAVGPREELSMGRFLDACNQVGGGRATFTWADAAFLDAQKVEAWSDMPVWVPPTGDSAGFARTSNARAVARGLAFRPVADTVKATLDWFRTLPADRQAKLKAGLASDRENEVLVAWHARKEGAPSNAPKTETQSGNGRRRG